MEIIQKQTFFSREGKASAHMHSILFRTKNKRPLLEELSLIDPAQFEMSFTKAKEKPKKKQKTEKQKPSYPFNAVSRTKYDLIHRNRTDSPIVGRYTPNYSAIDPNTNRILKYTTSTHRAKHPKYVLPSCIDDSLNCTYSTKILGKRSPISVMLRQSYSKPKLKQKAKPMKIQSKIESPSKFELEITQKPVVSKNNSITKLSSELIHQKTDVVHEKRSRTVSFKKMLGRSDLIRIKVYPGPYDVKEDSIRPRTGIDVLNFSSSVGRKPLVNRQHLSTPKSPELEKFDKAFNKQSTVRG